MYDLIFRKRLFNTNGGVLRDGERVLDLYPGDVVAVRTDKGVYKGSSVILTLGPWATKFLSRIGVNVPLKVERVLVCYWKEQNPGEFGSGTFPTFRHIQGAAGHNVYALPSLEYPGLVKFIHHAIDKRHAVDPLEYHRFDNQAMICVLGVIVRILMGMSEICLHYGEEVDPDDRDNADDRFVLDTMKDYVARMFPTLQKQPSIVEPCMYTVSPDINPVLDYHPRWRNVVLGAGFSGQGFKLAPVVGKILSDLSTGQKPSYNMQHFSINRFIKNKL